MAKELTVTQKNNIKKYLGYKWSDEAIATLIGISKITVAVYRTELGIKRKFIHSRGLTDVKAKLLKYEKANAYTLCFDFSNWFSEPVRVRRIRTLLDRCSINNIVNEVSRLETKYLAVAV